MASNIQILNSVFVGEGIPPVCPHPTPSGICGKAFNPGDVRCEAGHFLPPVISKFKCSICNTPYDALKVLSAYQSEGIGFYCSKCEHKTPILVPVNESYIAKLPLFGIDLTNPLVKAILTFLAASNLVKNPDFGGPRSIMYHLKVGPEQGMITQDDFEVAALAGLEKPDKIVVQMPGEGAPVLTEFPWGDYYDYFVFPSNARWRYVIVKSLGVRGGFEKGVTAELNQPITASDFSTMELVVLSDRPIKIKFGGMVDFKLYMPLNTKTDGPRSGAFTPIRLGNATLLEKALEFEAFFRKVDPNIRTGEKY